MTNREALEYMDDERFSWFVVVIIPYLYLIRNPHMQKFSLKEQTLWFQDFLDEEYDPSVMEMFPERMRKW